MYRVEDKYQLCTNDMYLLEKQISSLLDSDKYSDGLNGYSVSSIYFDDIYDSCFNDSVNGVEKRKKYRIRIYNDSKECIKLEIKNKFQKYIGKQSCTINEEQMYSLIQGIPIKTDDTVCKLFNIELENKMLKPKVIVTYDRKAYICEAGNVRVTFDRNLRCSKDFTLFGSNKVNYDESLFDTNTRSILEVKYDEFLPDTIRMLLSSVDLLQCSYSKYCMSRGIYNVF